jgi:acid phosphatase (class A)
MKHRAPLFALVLAGLCAAPLALQAQTPAAHASKPAKMLIVLAPADIDPSRLLPPPAADHSAAQAMELADLHNIIAAATSERMTQAKWDDEHEDPSAFFQTIGGGFDLKTLPATAEVLRVVMNDQAIAASAAKKLFLRKRPWVADPTISTCDPNDNPLSSYPSGHSMMGFSVGMILAALMPEKAQAILARASDYAFSREICGSHYPSDTHASQALAAAVATAMLKSPAFAPKFDAARAELRAAGLTAK